MNINKLCRRLYKQRNQNNFFETMIPIFRQGSRFRRPNLTRFFSSRIGMSPIGIWAAIIYNKYNFSTTSTFNQESAFEPPSPVRHLSARIVIFSLWVNHSVVLLVIYLTFWPEVFAKNLKYLYLLKKSKYSTKINKCLLQIWINEVWWSEFPTVLRFGGSWAVERALIG